MKNRTLLQKTGNKYGAKASFVDGIRFDSGSESRQYLVLKGELERGEIKSFERQVKYKLYDEMGVYVRTYVADFVKFFHDGTFQVIDVKSPITRNLKKFRDNERLMLLNYGIKIKIIYTK